MSDILLFRFNKISTKLSPIMAIFCISSLDLHQLIKEIKEDISKNLVPNEVLIFGFGVDETQKSRLLNDQLFNQEFESYIGTASSKIKFLNVSNDGNITDITTKEKYSYQHELLQTGANEIFKKRKGVITSTSTYHFSKPSGDHCDKFIRASNLFTSSVEVTFLAIGLLSSISSALKRVYVDTSSISFLVSTALHLSKKFPSSIPVIESFESYSLLSQQFNFIRDENQLVIISATTSGGLARTLEIKKKIPQKNIKTLFYSSLGENQTGLYNILDALGGEIYSESHDKCNLCANGSKVIRLEGEQFLPETPKHDLLMIKKIDFKAERQNFFREFAAKKILNINAITQESNDEFYDIDIPTLLKDKPDLLISDIRKKINKFFSRDINTIIHLDDEGSELLALKVKDIINDDELKILNFGKMKESDYSSLSSVFVVAGAITTGRKLLSVSRKLRCLDKSSSISYLVVFSKLQNSASLEQLRKDLSMGGHELIVLRNCFLPRISDKSKSHWDLEHEKLSQFNNDNPFDDYYNQQEIPDDLLSRLALLESPISPNELFLKDSKGNSLKIRETFVFWDKLAIAIEDSSQADVFWTIQTLLHDLRMNDGKGLSTIYHYTLLSPICFDRYNDGVIQACLLRSAYSSELNYAIDENYSQQMCDIICSVVRNYDNEQGEGCLEFLMSIWIKHLRIIDRHLQEILSLENPSMPDSVKFLLHQIKHDLFLSE
ncbi:hypothetical protein DT73_18790 [Mangrovibacter sp. MFB070]|uniref:hypothetical protein n=1 Tax=Mangrovibacter sp. MFB070 TaxID=1224318 RepID=UPI0004D861D8|nr:hypothetical protein [Mangrovibacter sp. MFB070]KEA51401.1 hypothetical protein DT73_18790 [Mangrovibacter sp. MFB070]